MSNSIAFIGRLGKDAELKQVGSSTVLEFSVGNSTGFGDREVTNWFRCQLWGKRGEKIEQYLTKGKQVFVTGELSLRPWTTKEGVERLSPDVSVSQIDMIKGGDSQQAPAQQQTPTAEKSSGDEGESELPF